MEIKKPLIDEQARTEILAALGIKDESGDVATALVANLEYELSAVKSLFPGSARQHASSLSRVVKDIERLRFSVKAITPEADSQLIDRFLADERSTLMDSLRRLERACSDVSKLYRSDSRIAYINRKESRIRIVRRLLVFFEKHHQDRPKLRGDSEDDHLADFLAPCLRGLGIKNVPGPDRMKTDYIRPARRSRQHELDTMRQIADEAGRFP